MNWSNLIARIVDSYQQQPLVIALAGSVAVGKTTLAQTLAHDLQQQGLATTVMSTDHFLYDNATLTAKGIFDEKGFPESYQLDKLNEAIANWRQKQPVTIPIYHQPDADIVNGQTQVIPAGDVLIVEGVVALQMDRSLVDWPMYVEAQLRDIEHWYLTRTMRNIQAAAQHPESWYYPYSQLDQSELTTIIMDVWQKTNLPNLNLHIQPSRQMARVILHKNAHHEITDITVIDG
jgi:type I pantothenate kinase